MAITSRRSARSRSRLASTIERGGSATVGPSLGSRASPRTVTCSSPVGVAPSRASVTIFPFSAMLPANGASRASTPRPFASSVKSRALVVTDKSIARRAREYERSWAPSPAVDVKRSPRTPNAPRSTCATVFSRRAPSCPGTTRVANVQRCPSSVFIEAATVIASRDIETSKRTSRSAAGRSRVPMFGAKSRTMPVAPLEPPRADRWASASSMRSVPARTSRRYAFPDASKVMSASSPST